MKLYLVESSAPIYNIIEDMKKTKASLTLYDVLQEGLAFDIDDCFIGPSECPFDPFCVEI